MWVEVKLDGNRFGGIPVAVQPDTWLVGAKAELGSDDQIEDISLPAIRGIRDGKLDSTRLPISLLTTKEQNDLIDSLWDQAKLQLADGLDDPGDEYDPEG